VNDTPSSGSAKMMGRKSEIKAVERRLYRLIDKKLPKASSKKLKINTEKIIMIDNHNHRQYNPS
jgi:hypothetical protein